MIPCQLPSDTDEPTSAEPGAQLPADQMKHQGALPQRQYFELFNRAPVGCCVLDAQGLIVEVNLAAARLLGRPPDTLAGQALSRFILKSDRDRFNLLCQQALMTGSAQDSELRMVSVEGTSFWVRLDASTSAQADASSLLCVVVSDINLRKQNEKQLHLAASVFKHAREGIMITTADGTIVDVNEAFGRITGYGRDEVIGQNPRMLSSGRHEKSFYSALWRDLIEKGQWYGEIWNRRKSGEIYAETLSISALYDTHSGSRHYVALFADITRRKQAEELMLETNVNLEEKVLDRTKQLRMVSAQLMVSEERERRMLAQDLHDNLGQLLAIIKIKLTSLAPGLPPPSDNTLVELVDQADQAVRQITLNLSPPILHTLGMKAAFEWLAEEMERRYQLSVHIDYEGEPKPLIDEVQAMLFRSARELLINVARHARASEASLSCLCGESKLTLAVSDNGCGFKSSHSFGVSSRQNGFGLSSIHERIVNIGGEMEIDSSPGQGTTVTLTIPITISAKGVRP